MIGRAARVAVLALALHLAACASLSKPERARLRSLVIDAAAAGVRVALVIAAGAMLHGR